MRECLNCAWYWQGVEDDFPVCHCDGEAPCEENDDDYEND